MSAQSTTTGRRLKGGSAALMTTIGPAAAIILVQQVFFPLSSGLFVRGVIIGTLTALVALGMVLVYRANRIINFAQADLGFAPVVATFLLMTESGLPWGVAMIVGFALAVGLGAATERLVIRRFFRAPRLLATIATIGLSQVLVGAAVLLPTLWGLGVADMGGGTLGAGQRMPAPFEYVVTLGGVNFDARNILALVVAPVCLVLVVVFLRRSDVGIAIRASADSADRASLLGVPVFRLQSVVWMLAAGLGFVTVFLRSGILGLPILGSALAFPVLLRALVAFLVGRMTDLVGVTAVAVALGVLEVGIGQHHEQVLVEPALVAIVVLAMLARRRSASERVGDNGTSWRGADEVRPVPQVLGRLPSYRVARGVLILTAGAVALAVPQFLGAGDLLKATTLLVYTLLGLSLVLLSGWGGRISLGQMAYFATGAAVAAWMVLRWEVDLVVAMLGAGIVGAGVALLIGLPTLRLPGLYLAVVTFAFALATTSYLLNPQFFDWVPEERVESAPLIGGWDTVAGEERVYYLVLGVLMLTMVGLRNIRATHFGRVLVSLRDNERAAQAFAIDSMKVQLTAYALSGGIAAVAGALFMHSENTFDANAGAYAPVENIAVLTMVVVGGMTAAIGPLLGALFLLGTRWFLPGEWQLLAAGVGVISVLLLAPGGLAGVVYGLRDRLLRHLARRRGLVVPGYSAAAADIQAGAPAALSTDTSPSGPAVAPGDPRPGNNGVHGGSPTVAIEEPDRGRPLLEVSDLDVGYGDVPVLFGVDLQVYPGESVALLGTNGAGKSTLLRAVSGLAEPSGGMISFDGVAMQHRAPHQIAAGGLVQMPGGHGIFPTLTVSENLRVAAWLHRKDREAIRQGMDRIAELFPVVVERRAEQAGNLSGGQQQMLALAMAVLGRPKLLMIDELSLGLAPAVVAELLRLVDALRDEGVSLLVVEQSVNVALELADRAVFMERGQVGFSGPAVELLDRPDLLKSVFLGAATSQRPHVNGALRSGSDGEALDVAQGAGAAGSEPALEVADLSVSFGGVRAVDGVSFDVAPREIVGVIGPNGAGKTTLFDLISGVVPSQTGRVRLSGRDIGTLRAPQRARRGLGRSFQDARLFSSLTVEESIAAALERWVPAGAPVANALHLPQTVKSENAVRRRVAELIELLGLGNHRTLFVGELSTGTRRVVDLACLLAHGPEVVLLDEPASGIAQREVEALAPLIERVRDELDASVVLVEHDIPLVQRVADRVVAMDQGQVLAVGTPEEVLSRPAVVSSYLGEDQRAVNRSGSDDDRREDTSQDHGDDDRTVRTIHEEMGNVRQR